MAACVTSVLVCVGSSGCEPDPSPGVPECETRRDCDDGYACERSRCEFVPSDVGDACDREADCGPGQDCAATGVDGDGDGEPDTLAPTCQWAIGLSSGASCEQDDECGSRACSLGHCAELCAEDDDCRGGAACVGVPISLTPRAVDQFGGCMPSAGVLAVELRVEDDGTVRVPVPTHALSMTLVTEVSDPNLVVGIGKLVSPSGMSLWELPSGELASTTEQSIRYAPTTETSSVLLPSSSGAPLEPGVYRATVSAWQGNLPVARPTPRVRAIYRLGIEGRALDVNFHFMDLAGHACLGDNELSAARAADKSSGWQTALLPAWRAAFLPAGLALGTLTYNDEIGRPELDSVRPDEMGKLFALGQPGRPALDVYLVRSIYPLGVLAATGGTPGPIAHDTSHSGVVVSVDALCLLGWDDVGRLAARAAARYLGLHEAVDVHGRRDPLVSTGDGSDNLLYFRLGTDAELTEEQAKILRRSPVLR